MSPADSNSHESSQPANHVPAMTGPSPRLLHNGSTALTHSQAVLSTPMPLALSSGPSIFTLIRALRRRWPLAVSLGLLVGAIAAGATWWFLPQPKFVALRRVRVLSNPDYILSNVDRSGSGDLFQRGQLAYVTDRFVLNRALNKLGESNLSLNRSLPALEWLEGSIRAEFTSPEIMQVSISGDNPTELKLIVDEVVNAYLDEIANEKRKAQEDRLALLRKLKSLWESNLETQRNRLKEIAKVAVAANPAALQTHQQMMFRDLGNTKNEWKSARRELQKMEIDLKEKLKRLGSLEIKATEGDIDQLAKNDLIIKQHQAAKDKIHALLLATTDKAVDPDNNSTVKNLREGEKNEQAIIDERKKELIPSVIKMMETRLQYDTTASILNLKEKISFYETYEKQLASEVKVLEDQTSELGQIAPDLQGKNFNLTMAEKTMEQAAAAVNALEVEMQNKSDRIREWGPAFSKRPDDFVKRASASGVAGLGGFGFILLAVAFLEFRSRKIDSSDEVVYGLGMPLVGTLPCMPSRSRRLVGSTSTKAVQWKGMLTESIDAVRTLLLHAAQTDTLQIVMVTSAVGGEGKTSLSCHLAASLARSGRKTLLVDGDMRNPSCHRMFDVELESGLAELLRGEIEVAEAIHATPAATLSVVPAGQCDAIALQALAQGSIQPIFSQLRQQFDFIIVDSCPVLPVADSLLMGQQADAVVFSILRDVSRMPKVFAAYQRLAMLGIRMLGAVVNGTNEASYGSDYHYLVPTNREQAAV